MFSTPLLHRFSCSPFLLSLSLYLSLSASLSLYVFACFSLSVLFDSVLFPASLFFTFFIFNSFIVPFQMQSQGRTSQTGCLRLSDTLLLCTSACLSVCVSPKIRVSMPGCLSASMRSLSASCVYHLCLSVCLCLSPS